MKILFVSGNLSDGGAQRVIAVVSSALAERGHDVSVLLFARNEKEYPLSPKVKLTAIRDSFAEYSKMSALARTAFIRSYLKQLQPQAAVGFLEGGYALYLASVGMKFPKVASARIDPKVLLEKKGSRAMLDRLWFNAADAVVLQTSRQKQHAGNTRWKNQTVIANPVSDAALEKPPHDYTRPCRRIVMAGRLAKQKNYPMVFAAMEQVLAKYPDAVVNIFGKGGLEQQLGQQIEEKGLQNSVFLRGWTQDTLGEYEKGDIYVLSSDYEGMPNALMEAMAAGLPCVSTDCDTGPEDLITDGENGFLIGVNDADALARRLIEIMDMTPAQRQEMGEKAHKTMAENFYSSAIAGKWENLFFTLTGKENYDGKKQPDHQNRRDAQ